MAQLILVPASTQPSDNGLSSEEHARLLQQALLQLNVHGTILYQGQVEGVKDDLAMQNGAGFSYWYRAWLRATQGINM